jgi:hypothetical protein
MRSLVMAAMLTPANEMSNGRIFLRSVLGRGHAPMEHADFAHRSLDEVAR